MKLECRNFSVNGRLKGTIIARDDKGEPLWESAGYWDTTAFRDKQAKNMAERLGITEDKARAAIADATLNARKSADDTPADEGAEAEPTITARLPGLVDIVQHNGVAVFLFVTDGKLRLEDRVSLDGKLYVPPQGDLLIPVKPLPRYSEVARYFKSDTDKDLLDGLIKWHRRASNLGPDSRYQLVGLWVLHSWLADLAAYTPYVILYSRDGERGKSRQGKAITFVAYRGLYTETLQEANLFRWADSYGSTIFFDVMDIWKKAERKGSEDLVLARFDRMGAKVARVLDPKLGAFADTRYFNVYGPTIIATNVAPHDLLQSRGIIIVPPEARGRYENVTPEDALPLKERGCAFRARHLEHGLPQVEKPVEGRLGDILQPLAQIAALLGPDMVAEFAQIVGELEGERQRAASESADARLIEVVLKCVAADQLKEGDKLPNKALASFFNEGLPEKQQASPDKLGRRMTGIGFLPGKVNDDRARVITPDLLLGLAKKYGLTVPDKILKMELYRIVSEVSIVSDSFTPKAGHYKDTMNEVSEAGPSGQSWTLEHSVPTSVTIQPKAEKDTRTLGTLADSLPKKENSEGQPVPPKPAKACSCGSVSWWWRPASELGGPGGWVCQRCHPQPGDR